MHPYLVPQLREDVQEIIQRSEDDLRAIGQEPLVITGATGFVGTWMTLSYLEAQRELGLQGELVLVARRPENMQDLLATAGYVSGFRTVAADVRTMSEREFPEGAHIIHAATPARASLNTSHPMEMLDIITNGQRNLLQIATSRKSSGFLFLSSGAVYGSQPFDVAGVDESWSGAPDVRDPRNAYHEGKRVAELMGNLYSEGGLLKFMSARLFAFLAPFLPTNEHFAAGNFIGDAVAGRDITINSGGGSIRSYQYATDMCTWLWAILTRGRSGSAYNVGSPEGVSIKELAQMVVRESHRAPQVDVRGVDSPANVSRYVPSTELIEKELQVTNYVGLEDAIRRTLRWNGDL